ncbi:glycosyltransferase family 2 protein [Streptococcus suis]|nr:glycosyltransferase family 2 protein [Streptococcus suis]
MNKDLSRPLVSVIIPMYNAADYITETINSVLKQTYQNYEIIVVDDCSTDQSVVLVKEMMTWVPDLNLLENPTNSGVAISRNKGVAAAHGRYICFLDADDLWLPTKLEKQLAFAEANGHAFTFTAYQFADENGTSLNKIVKVPAKISYQESLRNHTIFTSTVMLDLHQLTKEQIAMPDVRRGQDTATWWKILKVTGYAYSLPEALSIYRRVNSSLSANKLKAIKRTWYLFRKVEGLSLIQTIIPFIGYAYSAVKRRI